MARDYSNGYICLHRKMVDWEWFSDRNTLAVFIYLLLSANWQDGSYCGVEIPKGSVITSYQNIGEKLFMSKQEVRTAIKHLELTHEITRKVTRKVTHGMNLITLVNWEKYQCQFDGANTQITPKATPKLTPNKEDIRNINKERGFTPPTPQEVREFSRENNYQVDAERFCDFYQSKGWMVGKNKMKDWKAAVRTWAKRENTTQPGPKLREVYYPELE